MCLGIEQLNVSRKWEGLSFKVLKEKRLSHYECFHVWLHMPTQRVWSIKKLAYLLKRVSLAEMYIDGSDRWHNIHFISQLL